MSGGIDSSVAAWLLKRQGYQVEGVTMLIWNNRKDLPVPKDSNSCYGPHKAEDVEKTKGICRMIGINHVTVDLSDLYERTVLKDFHDEYLDGRTPNPCVWCNAKVKFGAMVDSARAEGLVFDKFATGHYARIVSHDGRLAVARAKDLKKDQSYFLYRLSQEQLARTIFPLGDYLKDEIRKIDVEQGFHPAGQSESQDFYDGDYSELLGVEDKDGDIVMTDGKVVGRHHGIWHYTIGQRKGLGIAAPRPLYVLALRPGQNQVVVGWDEETNDTIVTADQVVWGAIGSIQGEIEVEAKIRSTGVGIMAMASEGKGGTITARFAKAVKAATAGQSLVLYKDGVILAGGIITEAR